MPDDIIDLDEYLEHHGIVGMKWGQLNGPPYPIKAGNHSSGEKKAAKEAGISVGSASKGEGGQVYAGSAPKKTNLLERHKQKVAAKKLQEQRAQNLEKAREANKQTKAQHEADKKAAIQSGDANRIKQYANELTTQELSDAANRVNFMATINRNVTQSSNESKSVSDMIDNSLKAASKVSDWVTTGTNIYNNFAKIYNSLNTDDDDLPIIGGDNSNRKTAADKAKARAEKSRAKEIRDAIQSGDIQKVVDNLGRMTDNEVKDANARLQNEAKIRDLLKGKRI